MAQLPQETEPDAEFAAFLDNIYEQRLDRRPVQAASADEARHGYVPLSAMEDSVEAWKQQVLKAGRDE